MSETLTYRCAVCPAEPYVQMANGEQFNQVTTLNRSTQNPRNSIKSIPTHELAPENNAELFQKYRAGLTALHSFGQEKFNREITARAEAAPETGRAILDALKAKLKKEGHLETYHKITVEEFRKERSFPSMISRAYMKLPEFSSAEGGDQAYYRFAHTACLAAPSAQDAYIALRNEALASECTRLSRTETHDHDNAHRQRSHALAKALILDLHSGTVAFDPEKFTAVITPVLEEKMQWFERRTKDLRKKMSQRATVIDEFYNEDYDPSLRSLRTALRVDKTSPFAPPLTQEAAEAAFKKALAEFSPPPLVRRLVQIALNDSMLTVAMSNQPHADHISERSLDEKRDSIVIGTSQTFVVNLPTPPDTHTLTEELAHHAFRRMFFNRAKPYFTPEDKRRTLLASSIMEDIRRNTPAQFKKDFGLQAYGVNELVIEVPAKVMAMMATGTWDKISGNYPVISRYMDEVVAKDIATYEEHGRLAPYGAQVEKLVRPAIATAPSRRIGGTPSALS